MKKHRENKSNTVKDRSQRGDGTEYPSDVIKVIVLFLVLQRHKYESSILILVLFQLCYNVKLGGEKYWCVFITNSSFFIVATARSRVTYECGRCKLT